MQRTLRIFDLLFLTLFLATFVALLLAAYSAVRGRIIKAGKIAIGSAAVWAIYLGIVVAVSLSTPRRIVAMGEERCFDDWCITVEGKSPGPPVAVTLRVSSHAKRVRQSAPDNTVYLEDSEGRRYSARPADAQPSFGTMIGPGEVYETIRQFDVPANVRILGLVVRHSTGPGAAIIGDDGAWFHPPAIVKFE
jgi:hypothetical protein